MHTSSSAIETAKVIARIMPVIISRYCLRLALRLPRARRLTVSFFISALRILGVGDYAAVLDCDNALRLLGNMEVVGDEYQRYAKLLARIFQQ